MAITITSMVEGFRRVMDPESAPGVRPFRREMDFCRRFERDVDLFVAAAFRESDSLPYPPGDSPDDARLRILIVDRATEEGVDADLAASVVKRQPGEAVGDYRRRLASLALTPPLWLLEAFLEMDDENRAEALAEQVA